MVTSYRRPSSLRAQHPVPTRTLLAQHPPPQHLQLCLPALPSPPREPAIASLAAAYTLSTHLVPAAFPQMTPFVPLPDDVLGPPGEGKAERERHTAGVTRALLALKDQHSREEVATVREEDRMLLWNAVSRYVKKDLHRSCRETRKRGVTLFLTHANGLPKETWEPFIAHIARISEAKGSAFCVDEVWAFEAVQHGDSALVNEGKLGCLYDWSDNTRDILNFLLHHLPPASTSASSQSSPHPVHLPRLADDVAQSRRMTGFGDRTLIAIGHSFGGCTAALAAINVPALFWGLVLVDPIIMSIAIDRSSTQMPLMNAAVRRRSAWTSREEARRLFDASPFFSAWDPAALDAYVECALTTAGQGTPNPSVRLKMPGIQEAVVFNEDLAYREVYEQLPGLDERIELKWIMAGKDAVATGGEEMTADLVWRRPANCSNARIPSAGHLIPQEAPEELAREVYEFLDRKYRSHAEVRKARL